MTILSEQAQRDLRASKADGALVLWLPIDRQRAVVSYGSGVGRTRSDAEATAREAGAIVVGHWQRDEKPRNAGRTQRALQMLADDPDMTPYAAAKACGVDTSAVYRALARQSVPRCPCCGRNLKEKA